jgi:hypothetical protein
MDRAADGNSTLYDDKSQAQSASATVSIHSSQQQQDQPDAMQEKGQQVTEESGRTGAPLEPSKSRPSINNAAAIPDGGLTAWLQVIGAFFLFFNSWYVLDPILRSQLSVLRPKSGVIVSRVAPRATIVNQGLPMITANLEPFRTC